MEEKGENQDIEVIRHEFAFLFPSVVVVVFC
jgi:hypothetical protein